MELEKNKWYKSIGASAIFQFDKMNGENIYRYVKGFVDTRVQYNGTISNSSYFNFQEITDFKEVLEHFPNEQFELQYEIY